MRIRTLSFLWKERTFRLMESFRTIRQGRNLPQAQEQIHLGNFFHKCSPHHFLCWLDHLPEIRANKKNKNKTKYLLES